MRLSLHLRHLLYLGNKKTGNFEPDPIFDFIEECLTPQEKEEVSRFLRWLKNNQRYYTLHNLTEVWKEWQRNARALKSSWCPPQTQTWSPTEALAASNALPEDKVFRLVHEIHETQIHDPSQIELIHQKVKQIEDGGWKLELKTHSFLHRYAQRGARSLLKHPRRQWQVLPALCAETKLFTTIPTTY